MKLDLAFATGFFLGVISGILIICLGMRQAAAPAPGAVVGPQVQFQN